ncbi:MAG: outer membrane lipoprotein carrier protein LolA [Rhodospirillaceae bacterium]|jgi:outer membrane lipoprotein-sorting protein|nr:outer membrane lipoprotein carrier protein LolA [Rhodospirillaceae bacterium]MBT5240854.1 outer membrane lipoprotein carrier protein LolA [Rhodospirillaceae bacterium]MBT5565045.1 outer membrane lipoprotein carrier protein LolA [Rhodospirillaceae bacterium]MBT6090191.1 outer membrane lipoprotein carrier protein LolA [Rhodospirillaceae bacterium]MBT6961735.1 outer membrane lipoprotein carrier protein LolA [Rhodospirillaceae bacterium]
MLNMKKFCSIVAGLLALSVSTAADTPAESDADLLDRASSYLNTIDTLQARFLQVDGRGGVAEGDLYVDRPGKMRLAYDPPTPILIVADGYYVIYVDLELGEPSYLDIGDTPAAFLLEPAWSFTDDSVNVKNIVRQPGLVEITATQTNDPMSGELTFVFSEAPFELRQWRVKDAQSQEITVTLFETKTGLDLDSDLFQYDDEDVFEDD